MRHTEVFGDCDGPSLYIAYISPILLCSPQTDQHFLGDILRRNSKTGSPDKFPGQAKDFGPHCGKFDI